MLHKDKGMMDEVFFKSRVRYLKGKLETIAD